MGLSSVGSPAWNSIRGVRFVMLHGLTFVPILVTHDALDNIERVPPEGSLYLTCFNRNGGPIEQVASAKHERGECEEDGVVIVQAHDLKTASR
jgi:hypothetical protein